MKCASISKERAGEINLERAMTIRLRLGGGRRIQRKTGKNRHVALAAAALLSPAILTAYVFGAWRLGSDLGFTGQFPIPRGVFSHWQAWIALGAGLNIAALALNGYGRRGRFTVGREPESHKPAAAP
jgi:hypothetical protein